MMLQAHLGSVLDLKDGPPHQMGCRSACHGTSHTELSLTSYFRSTNRSIGFYDIADEACCQQCPENSDFRKLVLLGKVVEYTRKHPATTTGRGCNNLPTSCILFTYCK